MILADELTAENILVENKRVEFIFKMIKILIDC